MCHHRKTLLLLLLLPLKAPSTIWLLSCLVTFARVSFSVGTPGSYLTSFSNSFGSHTPDLANTGVSMSGYTQLPADWAAVSGVTQILYKPTISTVSATGEYTDILGLPLISTCGYSYL